MSRFETKDSCSLEKVPENSLGTLADISLSLAEFFLSPTCSASLKPQGDQEPGARPLLYLSWIIELASDQYPHIHSCLFYTGTRVIFLEPKYDQVTATPHTQSRCKVESFLLCLASRALCHLTPTDLSTLIPHCLPFNRNSFNPKHLCCATVAGEKDKIMDYDSQNPDLHGAYILVMGDI